MVKITTRNSSPLPLNGKRAKPYPVRAQTNTCITAQPRAISIVFSMAVPKPSCSNTTRKLSSVKCFGIQTTDISYISAPARSDMLSIYKSGYKMTKVIPKRKKKRTADQTARPR